MVSKNKVLEFVMNNPDIILEPSVGQGDLIEIMYNNNSTYNLIRMRLILISKC